VTSAKLGSNPPKRGFSIDQHRYLFPASIVNFFTLIGSTMMCSSSAEKESFRLFGYYDDDFEIETKISSCSSI
jgi:hypothetical protein